MHLSEDRQTLLEATHDDIVEGRFTVPNTVTSIGRQAFGYLRGLTYIELPDAVTYIGDRAFVNCTELTQIKLPAALTYLGDNTFEGCTNLREIIIDAPNDQEYQRIRNLLPENLRNYTIPKALLPQIKKAKQVALFAKSSKNDFLLKELPENLVKNLPNDLVNSIRQFDANLHDIINQVMLPQNPQFQESCRL